MNAEPYGQELNNIKIANINNFSLEKLSHLVMRYINNLKKQGKKVNTLSAYRNDLSLFSEFLLFNKWNPGDWSVNMLDEWEYFLTQKGRHSGASLRRGIMSVRSFLHFLVAEKILESSPILERKSPKQPEHDLLIINEKHYNILISVLKENVELKDEKSIRDLALILIFGECALKVTEAVKLTWGDVVFADDFTGFISIKAKNERSLQLSNLLVNMLSKIKYIRENNKLNTTIKDKVFFGYRNLTRIDPTPHINRHGIKFVLYEICNSILGIPYNAESFRNKTILSWINEGLSNEIIAEQAGYSSLKSLNRFINNSNKIRLSKRKTEVKKDEE